MKKIKIFGAALFVWGAIVSMFFNLNFNPFKYPVSTTFEIIAVDPYEAFFGALGFWFFCLLIAYGLVSIFSKDKEDRFSKTTMIASLIILALLIVKTVR